MLCKYCGRLVTSKSQCLCCGSSVSNTKPVKLTPDQIKSYELAVKAREEAMLKAEQERIAKNAELEKKKKKLVANVITAVGLGLALTTVVLMLIKVITVNTITLKSFASKYDLVYSVGEIGLTFGIFSAIALILAGIISKKAKIKLFFISILIGIVCVPIGFIGVTYGNNSMYCSLSISGVKTEYVVGEELDLSDLKILAIWESGREEEINLEDFKIVVVPYNTNVDNPEIGTIYIENFHSDTASSGSRLVQFQIYMLIEENTGQSAHGEISYTVNNT